MGMESMESAEYTRRDIERKFDQLSADQLRAIVDPEFAAANNIDPLDVSPTNGLVSQEEFLTMAQRALDRKSE